LLLLKGTKELCEIQLGLLLKIVHQSWQSKKTNKQIAITSQLEELKCQKNFENKILQDNVSQLEARLIETNSELADARSKLNEKDNELLEIQRKFKDSKKKEKENLTITVFLDALSFLNTDNLINIAAAIFNNIGKEEHMGLICLPNQAEKLVN
jgi:hypothetical protein